MKKIVLTLMLSLSMLMASEYKLDQSKSKVYYDAKKDQFFSTYKIHGENTALSGFVNLDNNNIKGELYIDASKFTTDSSTRDSNVADDLNSATHPKITFIYEIKKGKASGIMSVNGVSKELTFDVIVEDQEKAVSISGEILIKYTDFGLETPSNLILSAHDTLTIGANLSFNK